MKEGVCKLCKKKGFLLKKSHLIPDFFYKEGGLYDKNHTFYLYNYSNFLKRRKSIRIASGLYEGNILCSDCDNRILGSNLEGYGKRLLFGELRNEEAISIRRLRTKLSDFIEIGDFNYSKLKLLLISIYWRCSISNLKYLKNFKLEDKIEEQLRIMILNDEPLQSTDFPLTIMSTNAQDKISNDYILPPIIIKHNGITFCSMGITGLIIDLYIDYNGQVDSITKDIFINPDMPLMIPLLSGETSKALIYRRNGIPY